MRATDARRPPAEHDRPYHAAPHGSRPFTGQEHDAELGLINMHGRMYDPVLGQFLSPDPVMQMPFSQGFNRFAYTFNNPLSYVDPSGFEASPTTIGIDVGIGVAYGTGLALTLTEGTSVGLATGVEAGASLADAAGAGTGVGAGLAITVNMAILTSLHAPSIPAHTVNVASRAANMNGQGTPPTGRTSTAIGTSPVTENSRFYAAERGQPGPRGGGGGGDDSIRNLPLKDGKYQVQHIPQRYLRILQPLFHQLHLNAASVPVIVKPIPQPSSGPVNAQARGWVVVVDPDYLARATTTDQELFGTFAHEVTHVLQQYRLGSEAASNARFRADVERYGVRGQYDVPPELDALEHSAAQSY